MKQLFVTLLCLVGLALTALMTCAADADPSPVNKHLPTLYIAALRDTGGLPEQSDGTTLNEDITAAFRKIITDEAKGAVSILEQSDTKKNNGAWTLEGDLSGVDNGQGTTNYLCVMRLYRDGKKRELLAQWSGVAENLRFLTNNIPQISGVHVHGLVGEIGQRVLNVINSDGTMDFMQLLAQVANKMPEAKGATINLSTAGGKALPVTNNLPQVTAGMPFVIDVATPQAGPYLFAVQSAADIRLASLLKTVKHAGVYGRMQFTAPTTNEALTVRMFIVLRAKTLVEQTEQVGALATAPTPNDASLPVRIQEVITRQAQANATIADALMTMMQNDPPGGWLIKTVDYRLVPAK